MSGTPKVPAVHYGFLTGLIVRDTERLQNPTVLVITDRKDLDGQLFEPSVPRENSSVNLRESRTRMT